MKLDELLNKFRSADIEYALRELNLPVSGTKTDRIARIVGNTENVGGGGPILRAFKEDDLRRVAGQVGLVS